VALPEGAGAEKPLQILLVEDNAADVRMTREALAMSKVAHALHVVGDGHEALAFVRREGAHAAAPTPDLMLLDLALPGLDGHGVLEALRRWRSKRTFPIVVLTGSRLDGDVARSYAREADSYIRKPAGVMHYAAELEFALGLARKRRAGAS
jgi:CheY-like chemotaxis protein